MAAADLSTPVVAFRANDYRALGLVRSLGRMGVRVILVDHDSNALATKSRYCAEHVHWNFETSTAAESVEFLLSLGRRLGSHPVLVAGGDRWNLFVDRYRDALAQTYRFPRPGPGAMERLYSKRGLHELCVAADVPTAATSFPNTLDDALAAVAGMRFPVVLKAIDPDRLQRHAWIRMLVVQSPDQLPDAFRRLDEPGVPNLALQEFIPAGPQDSGVISAYFDTQGACQFALPARKLRQLPVTGGITSLAETQPCDEMVQSTCRIAAAAGYRGALDADFCRDPRDGRWKLLDVNPRMGANFRACVDRNGLDVARAMYFDLTGQQVPAMEPVWGRRWLVEDKEFGAMRTLVLEGELTYSGWFQSVRSVDECAFWSWDDLGPSMAYARAFAGERLSGVSRRLKSLIKIT